MTNLMRHEVWLVLAISLAGMASGCSMTSKNDPASAINAASKTQHKASSATPGSADLTSKKKLTNPIKVHLAHALWGEQQGNQMDARKSYDAVLKKDAKNIDAMLGLARLDMQLNRVADAEARLKKAEKVAPENPLVVAAYGQFYASQRDWPRALERMQTARTLSPYDPNYAYQLGLVQAQSGDLNAALSSLTEAVGPAEAHYNLGVILQQQGRSSDATEHLNKALTLKPNLAQAQKLLTSMRQTSGSNPVVQANQTKSGPESSSGVQPASYQQPAGQ